MGDPKGVYLSAEEISEKSGRGYLGEFSVLGGCDNRSGNKVAFNQFNRRTRHPFKPTGWKMHLSVAAEDVARATEIICEIYRKFDAGIFKVTRPHMLEPFSNKNNSQAGKMFTLYDTGEADWAKILMEIEQRLIIANIMPNHEVSGDRPIKGSRYAYYRNDGNFEGGKYMYASDLQNLPPEQRYNPLNLADPFKSIDVTPTNNNMTPSNHADIVENNIRGRDAASFLEWKRYNSPTHGKGIMRASVDNMSPEQKGEIFDFLHAQGIKSARMITSQTFGNQFVQVSSADALKLLKVIDDLTPKIKANEFVGSSDWKVFHSPREGSGLMRADINGLLPRERVSVMDYLSENGIQSAKIIRSKTFERLFVQVKADDREKLLSLIAGRPGQPRITNPRTSQDRVRGFHGPSM